MIVRASDLELLNKFLDEFRQWECGDDIDVHQLPPSVEFFAEHPHLLLPIGFDETRVMLDPTEFSYPHEVYDDWEIEAIRRAQNAKETYGINSIDFSFAYEYLYRSTTSGTWYWFNGLEKDNLLFHGPKTDPRRTFSVDSLIKTLTEKIGRPDPVSRSLWLPSLWTPSFQQKSQIDLRENVSRILTEIKNEDKELREIKPRHLEELVAELLREQGMEIYVTPQTRDGGRDVIARGELVPGEPMILAVEVKQKEVVGVQDLHNALKANEDYPALLLVTAGRFSAGVIRERQRKRHQLRLLLKDGVALSQWLDVYCAKHI